MDKFYVSKPLAGVPTRFENELQKEIFKRLSELSIDFLRVENQPAVTMEDCKNIDKAFGVETIKTVFLTNRQKTKFYLLGMPAEKPFVTRDFGSALQIPRVSFTDSETLEKMLCTPHGAATPLSAIWDNNNEVHVILDDELLNREKIVCTDGTLHGFICMAINDLIDKFLPSTKHIPVIIKL